MFAALRRGSPAAKFALLAVGLVALTYTPLCAPLNELFCAISYRGTRWMLDVLGISYQAFPAHRVLRSGSFGIEVSGLCSGMRGIAIWCAAVVFLPVPRWQKLVHLFAGTAVLTLVNCMRITHLLYAGAHATARFKLYHEWLWPMGILGLILAYRAIRNVVAQQHIVSAEAHAQS